MRPSPTYQEVADYFLAVADSSGDYVSNLKAQKLAYYAQAWHLALHGQPMFPEDFQAWIHGPVLPELYETFRAFGAKPITSMEGKGEQFLENFRGNYGNDLAEFMEEITREYFPKTAYELEELTHNELPWKTARAGLAADSPSNAIITKESMRNYYQTLLPV